MGKVKKQSSSQSLIDFDNPISPLLSWPDNSIFPLNIKDFTSKRTVLSEIWRDINNSSEYLIVTGFTSLSHLIELFGRKADFEKLKHVRIVLGFVPEIRTRKLWKSVELEREVKDYWAEQSYSLANGSEVINLIELIKNGKIAFKFSDRLHAKLYIGESHAILGSANFSKNGTTIQDEANIRIENNKKRRFEQDQYHDVKRIGENFYTLGRNFNDQIIEMLHQLLKITTWKEALARAISELIDKPWLKDIPELQTKLNSLKLWPSQRLGLGQALYILQTQGCVLIADPTGSGKTKMISSLQLVLYHWLWETGRKNRSYAITICPPLVKESWSREFVDVEFSQSSQISLGALSYPKGRNYSSLLKEIRIANILVVDEAHNFLNSQSNRSANVGLHTSDNIILATATPINKKPKDLIRLIELLGVDNLNDDELSKFRDLKRQRSLKRNTPAFNSLRTYIEKFLVRRTKLQLNELIDQSPEEYVNRSGNRCRYPKNIPEKYETGETGSDIQIAADINLAIENLRGILYLQDLRRPKDGLDYEPSIYIEKRLKAAKGLSKYNVQAKMRSSKAALLEHIEGTAAARNYYNFRTNKAETGNIIGSIRKHSRKLPVNSFKDFSPEWLVDLDAYQNACIEEIAVYARIASLSKKMSVSRELAKASILMDLFKENRLVIGFDSTVITLDYFAKRILPDRYPKSDIQTYVVTGTSSKTDIHTILKSFDLGSDSKNILALCGDAMSEGVNLQQASSLVFLDMPSVLRMAEQRIGRIDRLDSPHKQIKIWWPDDSVNFALKSDKRLITTMLDTESLIGGNVSMPEELLEDFHDEVITAQTMIETLHDDEKEDRSWGGIQDAFASVRNLYEGSNPLISKAYYDLYKDVDAAVKVKLSIGYSEQPWVFLAIKGTKTITPRWYFIDSKEIIYTELGQVCEQLRTHIIGTENWEERWSNSVQTYINKYVKLLLDNEISILPCKRKRTLELAKYILLKKMDESKRDILRTKLLTETLDMLNPKIIEGQYNVDYYHLSQQWLDIFMPYLAELKQKQKRNNKAVITLHNLKKMHHEIELTNAILQRILDETPLITSLWNRVASCMIGVPETYRQS
ncbi:SNF2-related protein [Pedobacter sp. PWIIR3]